MAIFVWSGQHDQWQILELLRFIGRSSSSNFDPANLHLRSYAQICRCCIWWSSFWDTHQLTIYPEPGETSISAHFWLDDGSSCCQERIELRHKEAQAHENLHILTFWPRILWLRAAKFIENNELPNIPDLPLVSQLRQEQQVQEKEEKQRTAERSPPLPQSDHSIANWHLLEEHETSRCYASCLGAYLDGRALENHGILRSFWVGFGSWILTEVYRKHKVLHTDTSTLLKEASTLTQESSQNLLLRARTASAGKHWPGGNFDCLETIDFWALNPPKEGSFRSKQRSF